jgi:predicted enzyme related to lactoylglutathione lyase
MERVKGIGGVFLKSNDAEGLRSWYAANLGIELENWGGCVFPWSRPEGATVWSIHQAGIDCYVPEHQPVMINFIVDDVDAMLEQLRAAGAEVVDTVVMESYGKFGWCLIPKGTRSNSGNRKNPQANPRLALDLACLSGYYLPWPRHAGVSSSAS